MTQTIEEKTQTIEENLKTKVSLGILAVTVGMVGLLSYVRLSQHIEEVKKPRLAYSTQVTGEPLDVNHDGKTDLVLRTCQKEYVLVGKEHGEYVLLEDFIKHKKEDLDMRLDSIYTSIRK